MKKYPFHLVTGPGKGASYSSLMQVGDLSPAEPLGQAKVRLACNLTNNNMVIADRALIFPEMKEPVVLGYCFNSQSPAALAWRLPIESFIPPDHDYPDFPPTIIFTEADGHETTYTRSSENLTMYFAPGLRDGTPYLQYDQVRYQWYGYHPKTQVGEIYNLTGRLIERRDAWGNRTQFTYNKDTGQLESIYCVTSKNKYSITRTVRSDGSRAETISRTNDNDPTAHVFQAYEFDKNGLLITSTASINGLDFTDGYKTTYQYAAADPLVLTGITQDDGTDMTFQYVSSLTGQLQTIYLPAATGVTRTDFQYSPGKVGVTVKGGWKADFLLDSQSRVIQKDQYTNFNDAKFTTESTHYEYAPTGQLQKITQPDGGQESFTYSSPFGLLTRHIRPNNQQADYIYDEGQNRPLLTTETVTIPDNKTPLTTYYINQRQIGDSKNFIDEKDYLRYEISSVGRVTSFEPSPDGPIQFKRRFLSNTITGRSIAPVFEEMQQWQGEQNPQAIMLTEYTYNDQGFEIRKMRYATVDEKGVGVRDAEMSQIDHSTFNDFGDWINQEKQLERTDQDEVIASAETNRLFDGLQRSTSFIDPLDNLTTTQYAINNDKTYDLGVYTIAITQPNQRLEKTILDAQGDPLDHVVTIPKGEGAYSQPQVTHWNRDVGGRAVSTKHPDDTTTFQSFYNDNTLGLSITATGIVTEHQIDHVHNFECDIQYKNSIDVSQIDPYTVGGDYVKSQITPDDKNDRISYRFYDSLHRLCFVVDAKNQVTEYRYDDLLNQHTAKIRYQTPLTDEQIATLKTGVLLTLTPDLSKDRCTSYYYDNDKVPIGEIDPDGWVTENILDNAGRVTRSIRYSTPNRAAERSSDFASMRPVPSDNDGVSYFFYNARGQTTVAVDPENYVTATTYYASEKTYQTKRYYKPLASWDPSVCPPMPEAHPEDRLITTEYDAVEREINRFASNSVAKATQYTNMGKICLERSYDTRFSGTEGTTDPDQTRTEQKRYDAWDNIIQTANSFVSQKLAEIEANEDLTPDEKATQTEIVWNQSSLCDTYDDVTGLKLKSTDSLNRTTIFYYDQERRLILGISPKGTARQIFYTTFHEKVTTRAYANQIPADKLSTLEGGFITNAVLALLVENADEDIIEEFTYSKLSEQISKKDPEGYITQAIYNAFKEKIEEQLPVSDINPSLSIQHQFNPRGQETTTIRKSNGVSFTKSQLYEHQLGKMTASTDEEGAVTQLAYDRVGNPVIEIDPLLNTVHQKTFDAFSRILEDKDAKGAITASTYNQQVRTVTQERPISSTGSVEESNIFGERVKRTNALGKTRTASHAPNGSVSQSTNEVGSIINDTFDTEGQHIDHIDPLQTKTHDDYDADGAIIQETKSSTTYKDLVTVLVPDAFSRPIQTTDPRNLLTLKKFNQRGLEVQQIKDPGTSDQPGLQLLREKSYNGQRTAITSNEGDEKSNAQYVVTFQQDGFNRSLGKTIDPSGVGIKTSLSYDKTNRVTRNIDGENRSHFIFYDAKGQKRFEIDGVGAVLQRQFDENGLKNLVRIYITPLTAEELAGISESTTLEWMETFMSGKETTQDTLTYLYYDENQRMQFRLSVYCDPLTDATEGLITEITYDGADHRKESMTYATTLVGKDFASLSTEDLRNWVEANASDEDRITITIVDDAGQRRYTIDNRGVIEERVYDALGSITANIKYAKWVNPQIIRTYTEAQMQQFVAAQVADVNADRIRYSQFNVFKKPDFTVITTEPPQCAVTQYQYDEHGNLTNTTEYKTPIVFSNFANLKQQLSQLTEDKEDRINKQTFDICNRQSTTIDALDLTDLFTHDALDLLITHTDRDNNIWTNAYDGAKRRIREEAPPAKITDVTQDSKGQLTIAETSRSVKTLHSYNKVNCEIKTIVDAEGSSPRNISMAYAIDNKQIASTMVEDAEVDDPAKSSSITASPVTKQTVTKSSIFNAYRKELVKIDEQGALTFKIYDSLRRLAYEIDASGSVIAYVRNTFGEVSIEVRYANPLTINLKVYADTGVPIKIVAQAITENTDADRYTFFIRNEIGDPISVVKGITKPAKNATLKDLQGKLFYFLPESNASGYFYAQINFEYDAFKQVIVKANLIAPDQWSDIYQWFDGRGNVLAVAEPVRENINSPTRFRVKRNLYSVFNQSISTVQYAGYMDINPLGMTLAQLDNYLSAHQLPEDREKQTDYDVRGKKVTSRRVKVTREDVQLDQNNVITFPPYKDINLEETYKYNGRGLLTLTQHEHLEGKDATQECLYYDERGFKSAHVGVAFPSKDDKDQDIVITPLTYFGTNGFGQQDKKQDFFQGASGSSIDPEVFPIPFAEDPAHDAVRINQEDNRGKTKAEQDPNGHVKFHTFTATGKPARHYQQVTNIGEAPHIDEEDLVYNPLDLQTHKTLKRDNQTEYDTELKYNAFAEVIAEGPGASPSLRLDEKREVKKQPRISSDKQALAVILEHSELTIKAPAKHQEYKENLADWQMVKKPNQILIIFSPKENSWKVFRRGLNVNPHEKVNLPENLKFIEQLNRLKKSKITPARVKDFRETLLAFCHGEESREKKSPGTKPLTSKVASKTSPQWPVFHTYDETGREIVSNAGKGVTVVTLRDLSGRETASMNSATIDLSTKTPKDFPALLTASYLDVQATRYSKDQMGRTLVQQLPDYVPGVESQTTYIPVELYIESTTTGTVELSWQTSSISSTAPIFSIYPAGDESKKVAKDIKLDVASARSIVDVSDLTTGNYSVEIDYYLIDPSTGQPNLSKPQSFTYGSVACATLNNEASTTAVAKVDNDHVLTLIGAVKNATDIILYDINNQVVGKYPLKSTSDDYHKIADLGDQVSGHYKAQLIVDGQGDQFTSLFVVNTALAPKLDPVLSREIPFTAELIIDGNQGQLILWQFLPLDFQNTPVTLICEYVDTNNQVQILEINLKPQNGVANIVFQNEVKSINRISITLLINDNEKIPLYIQESPAAQKEIKKTKEKSEDEDFEFVSITGKGFATVVDFAPSRVLYLRGSAVKNQFTDPPSLEFKDVSQNGQAIWKPIQSTAVTSEGLVINVSHLNTVFLPPGNYPFVLPNGDKANPYIFNIVMSGWVYDSTAIKPQWQAEEKSQEKIAVKDEPQKRLRQFTWNVFKGMTKTQNTLGEETNCKFNDLDQLIEKQDPPFTMEQADGVKVPGFKGTTKTHRNVDGVLIGTSDPADRQEAILLNPQNKKTALVLGDGDDKTVGTIFTQVVRDGFGQAWKIYDSRNKLTTRVWDRTGNLIQQIVPKNSSDGGPLPTEYTFNERSERTMTTDPQGNQQKYTRNVKGDIEQSITPMGYVTFNRWDRNGQKLAEQSPDEKMQIWTPHDTLGYFGVMKSYQSDTVNYQFGYNFQLNKTELISQGVYWQTATVAPGHYTDHYALHDAPAPNQHLRMSYFIGRLSQVEDLSLWNPETGQGQLEKYGYDTEDRRTMMVCTLNTMVISGDLTIGTTFDALNRETQFYGSFLSGERYFDASNNKRHQVVTVSMPAGVQTEDNWWDYDPANRVTVVDGWLVDGVIKPVNSGSYSIVYKQGVRYRETDNTGAVTSINFYDSGDIADWGQLKPPYDEVIYEYAPAGNRTRVFSEQSGTVVQTELTCNGDLFQTDQYTQNFQGTGTQDTTTLTPTVRDLVAHQGSVHSAWDQDTLTYTLDYFYYLIQGQYFVREISGKMKLVGHDGKEYTQSNGYYDQNGSMVAKRGTGTATNDTSGAKYITAFVTLSDGTIIASVEFPSDYSKPDKPGNTIKYYFNDTNNNLLTTYATFTDLSSEAKTAQRRQRLRAQPTMVGIKMNYSHAKNEGRWGKMNTRTTNLTGQAIPRDDVPAITQPVLPSSIYHNTTHLDPEDEKTHNPDPGFVSKISHIDGTSMPTRYTVKPGETFDSIAVDQVGRAEFGKTIAGRNGYQEDQAPTPTEVLIIPADFIPTTNTANDIVAYRTIQQTIQGSLLPVLMFQPKAKKQSCEETIVLTAIAVTACIVAPELAVGMVGFSGALATAFAAGIIDAGLQGVALGTGLIHTFSVENLLTTTLSAGIGAGLGSAMGVTAESTLGMKLLLSITEAATVDGSTQLAEMGLGLTKKFDLNQLFSSMAAAGLTTMIGQLDPYTGTMEGALLEAIPDELGSALIGSAITNKKVHLQQVMAQTIGTMIGTVAGYEIKSQMEKVRLAEQKQYAQHIYTKAYQQSLMDALGDVGAWLPYVNPMEPWDNLEWGDFLQDAQSSTNKYLTTADAPPPQNLEPETSEAKPNSYVTLSQNGRQDLNLMIKLGQMVFLNQFGPDAYNWTQYATGTSSNQNPFNFSKQWMDSRQWMDSINQDERFINDLRDTLAFSKLPFSSQMQITGSYLKAQLHMIEDSTSQLVKGIDPTTGLPSSRVQAGINLLNPLANIVQFLPDGGSVFSKGLLGIGKLLTKSMGVWMGSVDKTLLEAEKIVQTTKEVDFEIAPRVYDQLKDPRLGPLNGKLDANSLKRLANNPKADIYFDKSSNYINVVQEVDGRLLRITVPADTFKIISVGPIQERNIANSIASGRFIPISKGEIVETTQNLVGGK